MARMVLDAKWKNGAAYCPGAGCRERLANWERLPDEDKMALALLPGYEACEDNTWRWKAPIAKQPMWRGRDLARSLRGAGVSREMAARAAAYRTEASASTIPIAQPPIVIRCRRCAGHARVTVP